MAASCSLQMSPTAEMQIVEAYGGVTAFDQRCLSYTKYLTNMPQRVMDISCDVLPNTAKPTCIELHRRIIELNDKLKNLILTTREETDASYVHVTKLMRH